MDNPVTRNADPLSIFLNNIVKILIAGDFHIPNHDSKLLDLLYVFIADLKPDIFVINGDFLDNWQLSKFPKVPGYNPGIKTEIEIGNKILTRIREIIPEAEIYYIEGNHEFRIRQYLINNAPDIYDIVPDLPDLLGLENLNINWVGTKPGASKWTDTYKKFGKLYIGHWNRVSKHSAYTAKNLVDDKGISLIQNHVHRGGTFYRTLEDGRMITGIENFCMCSLNPEWMGKPNWQQGFTVVYSDLKGSGRFHAYPICIPGYKFFWGDKVYESNKEIPKKLTIEVL